MNSASREDYIKSIYTRSLETGGAVTTSYIAERLCVSQAAISDMLKKLKSEEFVHYEKYRGVILTEKGIESAKKVLRRHRLWELFLTESLGMKWEEVHDEAERLEHETSDELINRIEEYLNYPKFDPHGAPIPDANGMMPEMESVIPLNEAAADEYYAVLRVNDSNREMIEYLSSIGLAIGTKFKLIEVRNFDQSVSIKLKSKTFSLSSMICKNLFVKISEGE